VERQIGLSITVMILPISQENYLPHQLACIQARVLKKTCIAVLCQD